MLWFKRFCELTFVRVDVLNVEGSRILGPHPQPRYRELLAVSLAGQGCEHVRSRGLEPLSSVLSGVVISHSPVVVLGIDPILEALLEAS